MGEATAPSRATGSAAPVPANVPMPARAKAWTAASVVSWVYVVERRRLASSHEASSMGASAPTGIVRGNGGIDEEGEGDVSTGADGGGAVVEGRPAPWLAAAAAALEEDAATDDGLGAAGAAAQPLTANTRRTPTRLRLMAVRCGMSSLTWSHLTWVRPAPLA